MIKTKTRYRFNLDNLKYIIQKNSHKFLGFGVLNLTTFIPLTFMPEDIFLIVLVFLLQISSIGYLTSLTIGESRDRNLPIIQKLITEYEYKEKIIPYFKFEQKYKKTKKQQV